MCLDFYGTLIVGACRGAVPVNYSISHPLTVHTNYAGLSLQRENTDKQSTTHYSNDGDVPAICFLGCTRPGRLLAHSPSWSP